MLVSNKTKKIYMKKSKTFLIVVLAFIGILNACKSDFLDVKPKGYLSQDVLATAKGVDALLIGSYHMLMGVSSQAWGWDGAASNWVWGSIRALEANKGSDAGDQPDLNPIQTFVEQPTNSYIEAEWEMLYEAVSRCNNTIITANQALANKALTQDDYNTVLYQCQALRGWYHFQAWRMWGGKVPYVDEKTDAANVTNTPDIRANIIADLTAGLNLPPNMGQVGRFNKTVVQVLLAEALMQMNKDYAGAQAQLVAVTGGNVATTSAAGVKPDNSAIGLATNYGDIFDAANRNGIEAVYTLQYSVNDGSGGINGGEGEVLNFPYNNGPGTCCGFYIPNQDLVNSFRTTAGGLPLLDGSYDTPAQAIINDENVPNPNPGWNPAFAQDWNPVQTYDSAATTPGTIIVVTDPSKPAYHQHVAYKSLKVNNKGNNPLTDPASWTPQGWQLDPNPIDPRLDWTVGRRDIPYLDWGMHGGASWIRDQSYSGPYSPKKQVYKKSQTGTYTEVGNWTSGWTANGYRMVRYADVVLLLAECEIQQGDLTSAFANINLIRNRAANASGFVLMPDMTMAANYVVKPYPAVGVYPFDSKDNAMIALQMERKLELGMEGHRWFDLNRWGITQTELNRILNYTRTLPWGHALYGNASAGSNSNIFPVPQYQLDLSAGKLSQNQ